MHLNKLLAGSVIGGYDSRSYTMRRDTALCQITHMNRWDR